MNEQTIGGYVREQRRGFISLRGFAKEVGIAPSYLSDIELGKRHVSKDMVMRICCGLGRIRGGNVHERYEEMLLLSGHCTRERLWLLCFRERSKGVEALNVLRDSTYDCLYEEFDLAFYGFPINKVDMSSGDAQPYEETKEA